MGSCVSNECGSCTAGKPLPMGLFSHCAEPQGGLEVSHGELGDLCSCQGEEKALGDEKALKHRINVICVRGSSEVNGS